MINKTIHRPKIMSDAFSKNMRRCLNCYKRLDEDVSGVFCNKTCEKVYVQTESEK